MGTKDNLDSFEVTNLQWNRYRLHGKRVINLFAG